MGVPNAVTGLPYTLVEVDDEPKSIGERVRTADTLQWKLWIQQYAWLLSLITAMPGVALIMYTLTGNLPFSVSISVVGVATPGLIFWRRTRRLT